MLSGGDTQQFPPTFVVQQPGGQVLQQGTCISDAGLCCCVFDISSWSCFALISCALAAADLGCKCQVIKQSRVHGGGGVGEGVSHSSLLPNSKPRFPAFFLQEGIG